MSLLKFTPLKSTSRICPWAKFSHYTGLISQEELLDCIWAVGLDNLEGPQIMNTCPEKPWQGWNILHMEIVHTSLLFQANLSDIIILEHQLSVVKAWVRLFYMYLCSTNTSIWFIHTSVFLQWLVNIMKLKDFSLSPTQLIRLYLSRDEDGWDCHHQQKQTQRLIGGNYAG